MCTSHGDWYAHNLVLRRGRKTASGVTVCDVFLRLSRFRSRFSVLFFGFSFYPPVDGCKYSLSLSPLHNTTVPR